MLLYTHKTLVTKQEPVLWLNRYIKRKSYFPNVIERGYFRPNITTITLLGIPLENLDLETFWDNLNLQELQVSLL